MSVSIQTVEFERREAHLSELEDGPPFTVHGVALGDDDVTVGQSGIKKLWPAEELERAADSLEGQNLVVDHENNSSGVVGQVTKAGYKNGTGVIYEAELFDEELAEKINNGLLEVSIRGRHVDVEEMEENDDGAKVVEDITFANLSIVPTGAAPSNTIEMGETEELSVAELSAFTDQLADPEIEPGMWVRSDDVRGITISAVQDGEIEVDVYEESDEKWRSIAETKMMSVDSLDEWDVDEEEDVGPMEDDEKDEEENALTTGDTPTVTGVPDNMIFVSEEDAKSFIAEYDGLTGVHKMKKSWIPGATHDEFIEWKRSQEVANLEGAEYSRGDWVRWDTRNSTEIGTVIGGYMEGDDIPDFRGDRSMSPEGDEVLYALRMYKERDGAFHPIEGKPIGHYEDSVRSAEEPSNVSDSTVELGRSNHQNYDVEEEEWVQWYPSDTTEEHGFVLDVDDSSGDEGESIVTIEVWTQNSDGEWETDGEEITKSMEEVEPWGNFPREQEEFADAIDGEDPRRAVKPSEEENAETDELVSSEVEKGLKEKVEEHNEEHGDDEAKRVTYRMLKNVFERGMGAYQDSHREGMTAQQWSYARVNAFLYLLRNGNPENDAYTQDNDLAPRGFEHSTLKDDEVNPSNGPDLR